MRTKAYDVICLLFDEFELLDLAAFSQTLNLAGKHWNWRPFKLHLVAAKVGPQLSTSQVRVLAEQDLDDCPAAELLFIPGGYGARSLARSNSVCEFVRKQAANAQVVVTVAQGSLLLAAAGVRDISVALSPTHAQVLEQLSDAKPQVSVVDESWCLSGKFITASTSAAALDASLGAIQRTLGDKLANKVAHELGLLRTLSVAPPMIELLNKPEN